MKTSPARFIRDEWLQLLLLLLPLVAVWIAMPHADARVPMQWGMDGRVNWTAPKEWGLLVLPAITLLSTGGVMVLERIDPSRSRPDGSLSAHGKASRIIRLSLSALLAVIVLIQIAAATGRDASLSSHVPTLVALFIAVFGNFLGKLKRNRYIGFRLPWTLASEDVWRVTHRFAGALFVSTGLLVAILTWWLHGRVNTTVGIVWAAALFGAPILVSLWAARSTSR